jgi:hypothetical protein
MIFYIEVHHEKNSKLFIENANYTCKFALFTEYNWHFCNFHIFKCQLGGFCKNIKLCYVCIVKNILIC